MGVRLKHLRPEVARRPRCATEAMVDRRAASPNVAAEPTPNHLWDRESRAGHLDQRRDGAQRAAPDDVRERARNPAPNANPRTESCASGRWPSASILVGLSPPRATSTNSAKKTTLVVVWFGPRGLSRHLTGISSSLVDVSPSRRPSIDIGRRITGLPSTFSRP